MTTHHMRDYMDGRIDSADYVRRVKQDADRTADLITKNRALIQRIRERSVEQDTIAAHARRSIERARRLLRRSA